MKSYNVHVYNTRDNFHDDYMVRANDPVDARGVAVRRLIDETGDGLDVWEIIDVSDVPTGFLSAVTLSAKTRLNGKKGVNK